MTTNTSAFESAAQENLVFFLDTPQESFFIDRHQFLIGTHAKCHLTLPSGPALHSIIHQECGIYWVEASDGRLLVNGLLRRRYALRDGDILDLDGFQLSVRLRPVSELDARLHEIEEELSLLSAEELCDRSSPNRTWLMNCRMKTKRD